MIDYSIPEFGVTIGDLDVTVLVTKFEVSRPISELGQSLCWEGTLELAHSPGIIAESSLSPVTNPTYFRPDQKLCTLTIKGYTVLRFYIQRYVYDSQKKTGTASIYQLLNLIEGDRPSEEIETDLAGNGTPLGQIIPIAIYIAFLGTVLTPTININPSDHPGTVDDRVVASDPIKQAYDFASKNWRWLYCDTANIITDVSGDPNQASVIFARSINQCEIEPVFDNLNFAANHVIITGGAKQIKRGTFSTPVPPLPPGDKELVDEDNRDLYKKTETHGSKWLVYPEIYAVKSINSNVTIYSKPAIEIQMLIESKAIDYVYWGVNPSTTWVMPNLTSIGQEYIPQVDSFSKKWKYGQLVQTITTIQRAKGSVKIEYNAGRTRIEDNTLVDHIRYVETDWCKLTYASSYGAIELGFTDSSLAFADSFELTLVNAEPITQNRTDPDGSKPNVPELKLTVANLPDDPQKKPDIDLEDVVFKGQAFFKPVDWVPFRQKPFVLDVGFIPSQAHADMLAQQIGLREIRRRDAIFVTLPVPVEQLINGFKPLQKAYIHDGEYQIDEEIISLEQGELKYAFTGSKIGVISTVLDPPTAIPFTPGDPFFLANQVHSFIKNQVVSIQLQVSGGIPPLSFSGSLAPGLSLSSTGLITGVPTIAATADYSIIVTDSITTQTLIVRVSVIPNNPAIVSDLVYSELLESIQIDCVSEFLFASDLGFTISQEVVEVVSTVANQRFTIDLIVDSFNPLFESLTINQTVQFVSPIVDSLIVDQTVQFVSPIIDGLRIDQIVQFVSPIIDELRVDQTVQFVSPITDSFTIDMVVS